MRFFTLMHLYENLIDETERTSADLNAAKEAMDDVEKEIEKLSKSGESYEDALRSLTLAKRKYDCLKHNDELANEYLRDFVENDWH